MVWHKLPYTNFHDLNEDWITSMIRDLSHRMSDIEAEEHLKSDTNVVYVDTFNDVIHSNYPVGTLLITGGFYELNDKGSALYVVGDRNINVVIDNIITYEDEADNIVYRVLTDVIHLESFNYKNVSINDIIKALINAGVYNIHFDTIKTSESVILDTDGVNLRFNNFEYDGTGEAIKCVDVKNCIINGNTIKAANGTALMLTTVQTSSTGNKVDIRNIEANNGVLIQPTYSGILWNDYNFGVIVAKNIGLNLYLDDYDDKYVFIGEEHFTISNINSENIGVNIEIKPYNNYSRGTITGVIFDQLATELSNVGMRIRSGTTNNPDRILAGIKTVIVNNWRTREYDRTTTFLDAEGFLRDIIIRPNDPCKLSQWNMSTTSTSLCAIYGRFFNKSFSRIVAEDYIAMNGLKYFNKCTQSMMGVEANATIDFNTIYNDDSDLYMAKYFQLQGDATIYFSTYYGDILADGIMIYIPERATLTYRFAHSTSDLTFTNTGAGARYLVQNFKSSAQGTTGTQTRFTRLAEASS